MKNLKYTLSILTLLCLSFMLNAQENECVTNSFPFDPTTLDKDYIPPTLGTPIDGPINTNNNLRTIHWIHGMGGNEGSWSSASTFTNLYWGQKVLQNQISYAPVQYDLPQAASFVYNLLDKGIAKGSDPLQEAELKQNYIIAHSLGGLVSRRLEKYVLDIGRAAPYGGIVTFGTPHLGSKLADLKVNKPWVVEDFVNTTCKELMSAPVKLKIHQNFIFRWINRFKVFTDNTDWITNYLCEQLSVNAVPLAGKLLSAEVEKSIVPGCPDLQEIAQIPSMDSKLHTVAFYGEEFDEDDDLAIRFLFSVTENPNVYPLMGADIMDDDALQNAAESKKYYNDQFNSWLHRAQRRPFGDRLGGKNYSQKGLYDMAYAWRDGRDWYDKLNQRWKFLIGHTEIVPASVKKCYCKCDYKVHGFSFNVLVPVSCAPNFDCSYINNSPLFDDCSYIEVEEHFNYMDTKSDGLITRESATAFPNAKYKAERMDGSGHFQMRNDSELEKSLSALYNGDIHIYFKLGE